MKLGQISLWGSVFYILKCELISYIAPVTTLLNLKILMPFEETQNHNCQRVSTPYFMKAPLHSPPPPPPPPSQFGPPPPPSPPLSNLVHCPLPLPPTLTATAPFAALFLWLNGWSLHIWFVILLNIMHLHTGVIPGQNWIWLSDATLVVLVFQKLILSKAV